MVRGGGKKVCGWSIGMVRGWKNVCGWSICMVRGWIKGLWMVNWCGPWRDKRFVGGQLVWSVEG